MSNELYKSLIRSGDLEVELNPALSDENDLDVIIIYLENKKRSKCGYDIDRFKKINKYTIQISFDNNKEAKEKLINDYQNKLIDNLRLNNYELKLRLPLNELLMSIQSDQLNLNRNILILTNLSDRILTSEDLLENYVDLFANYFENNGEGCELKSKYESKIFDRCLFIEYSTQFNYVEMNHAFETRIKKRNYSDLMYAYNLNYVILYALDNDYEPIIDKLREKYNFKSINYKFLDNIDENDHKTNLVLFGFYTNDELKAFIEHENASNDYILEILCNYELIKLYSIKAIAKSSIQNEKFEKKEVKLNDAVRAEITSEPIKTPTKEKQKKKRHESDKLQKKDQKLETTPVISAQVSRSPSISSDLSKTESQKIENIPQPAPQVTPPVAAPSVVVSIATVRSTDLNRTDSDKIELCHLNDEILSEMTGKLNEAFAQNEIKVEKLDDQEMFTIKIYFKTDNDQLELDIRKYFIECLDKCYIDELVMPNNENVQIFSEYLSKSKQLLDAYITALSTFDTKIKLIPSNKPSSPVRVFGPRESVIEFLNFSNEIHKLTIENIELYKQRIFFIDTNWGLLKNTYEELGNNSVKFNAKESRVELTGVLIHLKFIEVYIKTKISNLKRYCMKLDDKKYQCVKTNENNLVRDLIKKNNFILVMNFEPNNELAIYSELDEQITLFTAKLNEFLNTACKTQANDEKLIVFESSSFPSIEYLYQINDFYHDLCLELTKQHSQFITKINKSQSKQQIEVLVRYELTNTKILNVIREHIEKYLNDFKTHKLQIPFDNIPLNNEFVNIYISELNQIESRIKYVPDVKQLNKINLYGSEKYIRELIARLDEEIISIFDNVELYKQRILFADKAWSDLKVEFEKRPSSKIKTHAKQFKIEISGKLSDLKYVIAYTKYIWLNIKNQAIKLDEDHFKKLKNDEVHLVRKFVASNKRAVLDFDDATMTIRVYSLNNNNDIEFAVNELTGKSTANAATGSNTISTINYVGNIAFDVLQYDFINLKPECLNVLKYDLKEKYNYNNALDFDFSIQKKCEIQVKCLNAEIFDYCKKWFNENIIVQEHTIMSETKNEIEKFHKNEVLQRTQPVLINKTNEIICFCGLKEDVFKVYEQFLSYIYHA